MGKSLKRSINKRSAGNLGTLKREDIINKIIVDIRKKTLNEDTKRMLSLFGITPEELLEAGAQFEEITILNHYCNNF